MADFYSTVAAVKARTGVQPTDLGIGTDEELTALIEEMLGEASDLMDRKMGRSWLTEDPIPKGLAGIAADIVSDSIRQMMVTRQTPVVRIDDFVVRTISAQMLSTDVVRRLRLYGLGAKTIEVSTSDLEPSDWSESE